MFALAIAGIVIGLGILFVTLLGTLAMIALRIWIEVMWLYVLPLIVDQDHVRRGPAPQPRDGQERRLVEDFGMLILLMVTSVVVDIIVSAIFRGGGGITGSAKYIAYQFITMSSRPSGAPTPSATSPPCTWAPAERAGVRRRAHSAAARAATPCRRPRRRRRRRR